MGSSVVALAGSFVAMVLSLLWLWLILAPVNWFWTDTGFVAIKLSLVSMTIEEGGHFTLAKAIMTNDMKKDLTNFLSSRPWIDEGVMQLCSTTWETIYGWCEEWKMAKWASLTMLLFGVFAVISLAAGGFLGYYYNQVHSTETGRKATITCYASAVGLVFSGLLFYVCLTIQVGMGVGGRDLPGPATEAVWMYCTGFQLACVLTLITAVPLYLQLMYAKKFGDEWKGGGSDDMTGCEAGAYGGGGYGGYGTYGASNPYGSGAPTAASYGTAGYGTAGYGTAGYGTAGYGTAGGPPAAGYGAAYAPQQMPYPVPGSGRPAW